MRASSLLLPIVLLACAPAEDPGTPDAGNPRPTKVIVSFSGTVKYHPLELAWRADKRLPGPPPVEGATLNVEDAIRAAGGLAPLKSGTVGEGGAFEVPDVDVTNVTVAVVASVHDAAGELMFSGYGLERGRPAEDLAGLEVFVVSKVFGQQLANALGRDFDELAEAGFVLGRIVDREGNGVEGAQFAHAYSTGARPVPEGDLVYFSATLEGKVSGGTSASGAFVLSNAGSPKEYTAVKDGLAFEKKLSGSRSGAVLSVFVREEP